MAKNFISFAALERFLELNCGTIDAPLFRQAIEGAGIPVGDLDIEGNLILLHGLSSEQSRTLNLKLAEAQTKSKTGRVFRSSVTSDKVSISTDEFNDNDNYNYIYKALPFAQLRHYTHGSFNLNDSRTELNKQTLRQLLEDKNTDKIKERFLSLQINYPDNIETICLAVWLNTADSKEFLEALARVQNMDLITFLKTKANLKFSNMKMVKLWHIAAWGGNVEILQRLEPEYARCIRSDFSDRDLTHYLAWSGNYSALKQGITESWPWIRVTCLDDQKASIWHYLALSGNYAAITQAIKDKQFDQLKLVDIFGDNVWSYFTVHCDYKDLLQAIEAGYCNPEYQNRFCKTIFEDVCSNTFKYTNNQRMITCAEIWRNLMKAITNNNTLDFFNYFNRGMNNQIGKDVCLTFFQYYLNRHDYSFRRFIFDIKDTTDHKSVQTFIHNIVWNNSPNIFQLIGKYKDRKILQALNSFVTNIAAEVDPSVFLEFYMFLQMKSKDLNQSCIEPLLQIVKKNTPIEDHFWEFVSTDNRKELLYALLANVESIGDSKYFKEVVAKLKELEGLNSLKQRPS